MGHLFFRWESRAAGVQEGRLLSTEETAKIGYQKMFGFRAKRKDREGTPLLERQCTQERE